MVNVRGIPDYPKKPEYQELPPKRRNKEAYMKVRRSNGRLNQEYSKAYLNAQDADNVFRKASARQEVKFRKGYVTELAAACEVRATKMKGHEPYDNPTEYIADLWTDGFIDDRKAQTLLEAVQEKGEISLTADENRLLADSKAREEILDLTLLEMPTHDLFTGEVKPGFYAQGSSAFARQEYEKKGVLIDEADKPELSEDSPGGFLLKERERGHISKEELKMMLAWQRGPEKTPSAEELTTLRQTVIQQMLEARPEMSKADAALLAMDVVQELRDPFAHNLAKLVKETEEKPSHPASVDIGELHAVKQGGFRDREIARAKASTEDKSPQR